MRTIRDGALRSARGFAAAILFLLSGPIVDRSTASAACGDGVVEPGEACDDGNHANCDRCSTACTVEITESSANDSVGSATGPLAPNACAFGAIEKSGDVDFFSFTIGTPTSVRVETFDASGQGRCAVVDTSIALLDGGGNVLASDDDGGIQACSRVNGVDAPGARDLAAGTYFVRVAHGGDAATTPGYALLVSATTPNATCGGRPATLVGTEDDEVLVGTSDDDVIKGKRGNDVVRGKLGDDVICGGQGDDLLSGGKGADAVQGGRGNDRLVGGAGDDHLADSRGTNTLDGRDGFDHCAGTAGDTIVNCEEPETPSSPTEALCNDGIDDEGDGLIDCADPDCNALACDDANPCTLGETCAQGGICIGAPMVCDDANDCTADVCVNGGCEFAAIDAFACDDENACTINDTCQTGVCVGSPGAEDCQNGIDDDCDELVDGDDPDCIP